MKNNNIKKSEILFLYETSYNTPNGDPFTGEQRIDEETRKILVSDVRIKRFIRTYLENTKGLNIYVSDKTSAGKTDSKNVLTAIALDTEEKGRNEGKSTDIGEILKTLIDVRLFGGISTLKDEETKKIKIKKIVNGKEESIPCTNGHVQFTGPVQFAMLNPSFNEVNLRMHQNTTHFTSKAENTQGSIGTTSVVPYSLIQIHGWVNPKVAEITGMTKRDLNNMYEGMWYGTSGDGTSHSRTKVGQESMLIIEIVYKKDNFKIYGVDRLIKMTPKNGKRSEQIRSFEDYDLDFSKLHNEMSKDDSKIETVNYFSEIDDIKELLVPKDKEGNDWYKKFKPMTFAESKAK